MARTVVSWFETEGVYVDPKVRVVVSWFELEAVKVEAVAPPVFAGGGGVGEPLRPFPVEGYGYGILPQIEGEAHGVVAVAGVGAGIILPGLTGEAIGSVGAAGRSVARLTIKAAARGNAGALGKGSGMIVKFEGAAIGRHDDDEAAIVAWLLAA
jgi:hypothetical protein